MCSTRPSKVLVIRPRNITTDRSDGDSSSGDLPFEIIEEINGHNELYSYRESDMEYSCLSDYHAHDHTISGDVGSDPDHMYSAESDEIEYQYSGFSSFNTASIYSMEEESSFNEMFGAESYASS